MRQEVCNKWHKRALQGGVYEADHVNIEEGQLGWDLRDRDGGVKEEPAAQKKSHLRSREKFGMAGTS